MRNGSRLTGRLLEMDERSSSLLVSPKIKITSLITTLIRYIVTGSVGGGWSQFKLVELAAGNQGDLGLNVYFLRRLCTYDAGYKDDAISAANVVTILSF